MYEIRGGFIYRDDGDGCLAGKYVNISSQPFGETAKRRPARPEDTRPFCGVYNTVWLETSNGTITNIPAILTIDYDPNIQKYDLRWNSDPNNPNTPNSLRLLYEGVGMLYGDLLVGGYWSV